MPVVRSMRVAAVLAAGVALAATAAGCGENQRELAVFAAVSLRAPLEQIAGTFDGREALDVWFSFAGSQQLRFQLEQGAEADVFVSADEREMERARDAGLIAGEPAAFAGNRLVVAVAEEVRERVGRLEDLARPGVRVVWAGEQVPLGRYSRQAVEALGRRFGGEYAARVAENIVSEEENAEAVAGKIELGEADAAFVYRSDAARLEGAGAAVIEIEDAYQPKIRYYAAVLAGAGGRRAARAFVEFLLEPEAQRTLREASFLPLR